MLSASDKNIITDTLEHFFKLSKSTYEAAHVYPERSSVLSTLVSFRYFHFVSGFGKPDGHRREEAANTVERLFRSLVCT